MDLPTLATYFSGLSFLFFGTGCLTSVYMKREFIRYGYDRQRPLVGVLQILGGAGLIVGYWLWLPLAFSAAGGLSLMMMYGFGVRMRIGDSLWVATPAFGYGALNLYLAIHYSGGW